MVGILLFFWETLFSGAMLVSGRVRSQDPLVSQKKDGPVGLKGHCQFAQVVLSYCHHPTTVENVRRLCISQPEFVRIYISRKPTGPVGKLAVLKSVFALQHPVIHIDDSPEVVTEIRAFLRRTPECQWKVIQIKCGRKALVNGVVNCANVREAAQIIFTKTGLLRLLTSKSQGTQPIPRDLYEKRRAAKHLFDQYLSQNTSRR